ncbi:MAG TPA: hypothetical protein VJN02_09195 [Gammaproteobacteria bacterium]|nr:hypothetical protein [Gammaproteobacteria bacterium]
MQARDYQFFFDRAISLYDQGDYYKAYDQYTVLRGSVSLSQENSKQAIESGRTETGEKKAYLFRCDIGQLACQLAIGSRSLIYILSKCDELIERFNNIKPLVIDNQLVLDMTVDLNKLLTKMALFKDYDQQANYQYNFIIKFHDHLKSMQIRNNMIFLNEAKTATNCLLNFYKHKLPNNESVEMDKKEFNSVLATLENILINFNTIIETCRLEHITVLAHLTVLEIWHELAKEIDITNCQQYIDKMRAYIDHMKLDEKINNLSEFKRKREEQFNKFKLFCAPVNKDKQIFPRSSAGMAEFLPTNENNDEFLLYCQEEDEAKNKLRATGPGMHQPR